MHASRMHRLLKLIALLQSGEPWRAGDLMARAGVARRTLFRDLQSLKSAGMPLNFDAARHHYTLTKNFFMPPINLTTAEALALLLLARKGLSRSALPSLEPVIAATTKLESCLPAELQERCRQALESVEVCPEPMTDPASSANVFQLLWRAAGQRQAVDLAYDSCFEGREIHTRLNPYRLVFISQAWYVIGYSSLHRQARTFKLDRILRVVPNGRSFAPDPRFEMRAYFGNAWQMIRGARRHHVRIRFSPKVAGNVEEVLWHATQQTQRREDGALIYEVDVDGVEEIAWWVLGYGREAEVESPPELRVLIAEHARAMAALYAGGATPAPRRPSAQPDRLPAAHPTT